LIYPTYSTSLRYIQQFGFALCIRFIIEKYRASWKDQKMGAVLETREELETRASELEECVHLVPGQWQQARIIPRKWSRRAINDVPKTVCQPEKCD
jgi:hypothetical protein